MDGPTLAEDRQAIKPLSLRVACCVPPGRSFFCARNPERHGGSALGDGGSRRARSGRVTGKPEVSAPAPVDMNPTRGSESIPAGCILTHLKLVVSGNVIP